MTPVMERRFLHVALHNKQLCELCKPNSAIHKPMDYPILLL